MHEAPEWQYCLAANPTTFQNWHMTQFSPLFFFPPLLLPPFSLALHTHRDILSHTRARTHTLPPSSFPLITRHSHSHSIPPLPSLELPSPSTASLDQRGHRFQLFPLQRHCPQSRSTWTTVTNVNPQFWQVNNIPFYLPSNLPVQRNYSDMWAT